MEKIEAIKQAGEYILLGKIGSAKKTIIEEYPFHMLVSQGRNYTNKEKMEQFVRDGFIDRYSGQKLVNPGMLKVLSYYMPDVFPYHAHWKMEQCHNAYWEFIPTIDHIVPVALGGADVKENWVTTSMLHNSIKSNWTLEQLNWKLYDAGDFKEYDGFTSLFIQLVEAESDMLKDIYIKKWYKVSISVR